MTWLQQLLDLFGWLRLWYTILPWEQGVRVRAGSHVLRVGPGLHFKLPLIDRVYAQNCRTHVVNTPSQVLTLRDGRTVVVVAVIGFSIVDVLLSYRTVQHLDDVVHSWASACIADTFRQETERGIGESVVEALLGAQCAGWGLKLEFFRFTDFANTRVFRIAQDGRYSQSRFDMDKAR